MNKKRNIISIVFIVLFGACMVQANTLFTEDEWNTINNWSNDQNTVSTIGKSENRREPLTGLVSRSGSPNTLFTHSEWHIVKTWNRGKMNINAVRTEVVEGPKHIRRVQANTPYTLTTNAEWEVAKNWNPGETRINVGRAEGYSAPEDIQRENWNSPNTLFTKEEWDFIVNRR